MATIAVYTGLHLDIMLYCAAAGEIREGILD
jgi:hypothetical protein